MGSRAAWVCISLIIHVPNKLISYIFKHIFKDNPSEVKHIIIASSPFCWVQFSYWVESPLFFNIPCRHALKEDSWQLVAGPFLLWLCIFYGLQLILLCRLAAATFSATAACCHRFPSSSSSNINLIIIIMIIRNRLGYCWCFGFDFGFGWACIFCFDAYFGVWMSGCRCWYWMLLLTLLLAELFWPKIFRLPFGWSSSVQVRGSNGSVCLVFPLRKTVSNWVSTRIIPTDWQDNAPVSVKLLTQSCLVLQNKSKIKQKQKPKPN